MLQSLMYATKYSMSTLSFVRLLAAQQPKRSHELDTTAQPLRRPLNPHARSTMNQRDSSPYFELRATPHSGLRVSSPFHSQTFSRTCAADGYILSLSIFLPSCCRCLARSALSPSRPEATFSPHVEIGWRSTYERGQRLKSEEHAGV